MSLKLFEVEVVNFVCVLAEDKKSAEKLVGTLRPDEIIEGCACYAKEIDRIEKLDYGLKDSLPYMSIEDEAKEEARAAEDEELADKHKAETAVMEARHEAEMKAAQTAHDDAKAKADAEHAAAEKKIKADREDAWEPISERHSAELDAAEADYDRDTDALHDAFADEVDKRNERHEAELSDLTPGTQEHDETVARHLAETAEMNDRHAAAVAVRQSDGDGLTLCDADALAGGGVFPIKARTRARLA